MYGQFAWTVVVVCILIVCHGERGNTATNSPNKWPKKVQDTKLTTTPSSMLKTILTSVTPHHTMSSSTGIVRGVSGFTDAKNESGSTSRKIESMVVVTRIGSLLTNKISQLSTVPTLESTFLHNDDLSYSNEQDGNSSFSSVLNLDSSIVTSRILKSGEIQNKETALDASRPPLTTSLADVLELDVHFVDNTETHTTQSSDLLSFSNKTTSKLSVFTAVTMNNSTNLTFSDSKLTKSTSISPEFDISNVQSNISTASSKPTLLVPTNDADNMLTEMVTTLDVTIDQVIVTEINDNQFDNNSQTVVSDTPVQDKVVTEDFQVDTYNVTAQQTLLTSTIFSDNMVSSSTDHYDEEILMQVTKSRTESNSDHITNLMTTSSVQYITNNTENILETSTVILGREQYESASEYSEAYADTTNALHSTNSSHTDGYIYHNHTDMIETNNDTLEYIDYHTLIDNGTQTELNTTLIPTELNTTLIPTMSTETNNITEASHNQSDIILPDIIATIKPPIKTTLPVNDINNIEPGNELDRLISSTSTTVASASTTRGGDTSWNNVPIYSPVIPLTTTTESDSFIISVNPNIPKPTRYPADKTSTSLSEAVNTIKGVKNPDGVVISQHEDNHDTDEVNHVTGLMLLLYIELRVLMVRNEVCDHKTVFKFQTVLVNLIDEESKEFKISYRQIVYSPVGVQCEQGNRKKSKKRKKRSMERSINIYIEDDEGDYSFKLTNKLAELLQKRQGQKIFQGTQLQDKVLEIIIHGTTPGQVVEAKLLPLSTGIIVAIVAVIVIILLVIGFVTLQVYVRWSRRGIKTMRHASMSARQSMVDSQSLADSIQLQAFVRMESGRFSRRRMTRGSFAYVNPGLELLDQRGHTSNPLTFIGLAEMLKSGDDIYDEFLMLPNQLATISDLPPGADDKNRYSNVIPNPKTRVPLHCMNVKDMRDGADYINANFIRGYQCYPNCYIATQAPMENTVYDFWRMVWQQNSTVIVMLTPLEEQTTNKCYEYWPNTEGGDTTQVYGEYRISQVRRIVMPEWIQTTLVLKYKKAKQQKEIQHFWLTSWPRKGIPDYRTLIKFMVHIRPVMDESAGPPVVHCSPGTGRTGVVIATDLCMLSFEDSSTVNVLNTVHQLRKDRGGMVQTKEQYAFIYKVILEYAKMLNNPTTSVRSSVSSTTSSFQREPQILF